MMAQGVSTQAQAMTAKTNRGLETYVNLNASTMTCRLRPFVRLSPSIFIGSKMGEVLQKLLDEVYKLVDAIGATSIEKVELATYQLKNVAQVGLPNGKPIGR